MIASIHTAKREPHRSAILAREWDMVIIDEAHHLRNRNTQAWKLAGELRKQFILLLTATPVQNNLEELFNLVTLLEPGLLSTSKQFQRRFVDRRDKLTPKHLDELHALLAEVMVRNRRSTVGLQFTRRWAHTELLTPSARREGALPRRHRVRPGAAADRQGGRADHPDGPADPPDGPGQLERRGRRHPPHDRRDIPSWRRRDRKTLEGLADRAAAQLESTKADRLLSLVDEFRDKMVVFTQFRATQETAPASPGGGGA